MTSIKSLARSGIWDHKATATSISTVAPLVLEGIIFAKTLYQSPHLFQEALSHLKDKLYQSFTVQNGNRRTVELTNIAKNSLRIVSCALMMGTSLYFSANLLSGSLAITTAISSVFWIGKLFLAYDGYKKNLIEAFCLKEGEPGEVGKDRILKNKLKALAITVTGVAGFLIGSCILMPMIQNGFTFVVTLPFQTKAVVFAEYALLSAVHGVLAYRTWEKSASKEALFYLFSAALSLAFPSYYLHTEMRLHHSYYGLFMMALPSRSLKFLGSLITFDSLLYAIVPWRGYKMRAFKTLVLHQYDFINLIYENRSQFLEAYIRANTLQSLNDSLK